MKPFDLYRMFQQNVYSLPHLPFYTWMTISVELNSHGAIESRGITIAAPVGESIIIDWGDGNVETYIGQGRTSFQIIHLYSSVGTKYVTASGFGFLDATVLICHNIGLTDLDVSNNKKLKQLACYGNNLTSLDVSENIVLEYLDCGGNMVPSLVSLNVLYNTNLTQLYCAMCGTPTSSTDGIPEAVNAILAALVQNGKSNGNCDLLQWWSSGAPTGQGLIDKETLISRGWIVRTN